jgi:predicted dehydrogenase
MQTKSSNGILRLACIGAGAIAQSYVAAFARCSSAKLVAVADIDVERATAVAAPLGLPAFSTPAALLTAVPCDGVIVCTPPKYHMEVTVDALRAGVNVLCEKPLAIGAFAARRMFAAAEQEDRLLTMASKFRFAADIIRAKELVAAGAVGKVLRIENTFMSPVDMTARWNSCVQVSGGGVIIDNGTHSVDIMRFFLGSLVAVFAVDTSIDPRYDGCDDSASVFVRSAGGVIGSVALSWSLPAHSPVFVRIHGSCGTIDVGWSESSYICTGGERVVFGRGYEKIAAFAAQIDNFAGAIAGRNRPALERDDAIASVEVIDAAYESLRKNTWSGVQVRRLTPFEKLVSA